MNTTTITEDRIEKSIELKAPVSRVWRALTDSAQFGQWFGVAIDGPFVAGKRNMGKITIKGFEHVPWNSTVVKIEPERYFSYTWHPYAVEPGRTIPTRHRPWSSLRWSRRRRARA